MFCTSSLQPPPPPADSPTKDEVKQGRCAAALLYRREHATIAGDPGETTAGIKSAATHRPAVAWQDGSCVEGGGRVVHTLRHVTAHHRAVRHVTAPCRTLPHGTALRKAERPAIVTFPSRLATLHSPCKWCSPPPPRVLHIACTMQDKMNLLISNAQSAKMRLA